MLSELESLVVLDAASLSDCCWSECSSSDDSSESDFASDDFDCAGDGGVSVGGVR